MVYKERNFNVYAVYKALEKDNHTLVVNAESRSDFEISFLADDDVRACAVCIRDWDMKTMKSDTRAVEGLPEGCQLVSVFYWVCKDCWTVLARLDNSKPAEETKKDE